MAENVAADAGQHDEEKRLDGHVSFVRKNAGAYFVHAAHADTYGEDSVHRPLC